MALISINGNWTLLRDQSREMNDLFTLKLQRVFLPTSLQALAYVGWHQSIFLCSCFANHGLEMDAANLSFSLSLSPSLSLTTFLSENQHCWTRLTHLSFLPMLLLFRLRDVFFAAGENVVVYKKLKRTKIMTKETLHREKHFLLWAKGTRKKGVV